MSIIFDMSSYETAAPTDGLQALEPPCKEAELNIRLQLVETSPDDNILATTGIYAEGINPFLERM